MRTWLINKLDPDTLAGARRVDKIGKCLGISIVLAFLLITGIIEVGADIKDNRYVVQINIHVIKEN